VDRSQPAVSRVENDKFRFLSARSATSPVLNRSRRTTIRADRLLVQTASHAPSSTSHFACAFFTRNA